MIRRIKSKNIIYSLVFIMLLNAPLTVQASNSEDLSLYEKIKSFIFSSEESSDHDQVLSEFRQQFHAGNNNMADVAMNSNVQSIDANTEISIENEAKGLCGSTGLETQIPYGPYKISTITATDQDYGFGAEQSSVTTVLVNVKKTADVVSAYNVLGATLVAQGEHTNIWIVNPDEYYSDYAGTFTMTSETLYNQGDVTGTDAKTAQIAINADVIYEKVTTIQEHAGVLVDAGYSNMPAFGDIDNDGRVNLILYDINSDAQNSSSYIAGYFSMGDYMTDFTGIPIDALHMDIGIGQGVSSTTGEIQEGFYGTFAHEFQHALFYTYFGGHVSDSSQYTWVNEGLSGVADLYYSDYSTQTVPDPQNLDVGRVMYGTQNSYENGSTYGDFVNWAGTLKNYGMSYMMSAMMEERANGYINKAYDYFLTNLVDSSNATYTYNRLQSAVNYTGKSVPGIWGEVFRTALGNSVDTSGLTSDEVMEYVYTMYMESYMAAGGQVIDNGVITATDRLWRNGGSLWSFRNGNRYYIGSGSYYNGNDAYEQINSGGQITLVGYPSDSADIQATHEMAYTLDQSSYSTDSKNILKINIPNTEKLKAYVALYDTTNANPTYVSLGPLNYATENTNYDPTLDTADLYPIELGVDNYIEVDSAEITPHLFAFTYYKDVNTTVTYEWVDEIPGNLIDISTEATLELLATSYDYDNLAKEPSVTVTLKETTTILTKDQDYTVTYSDNINVGSATVTIEGMGDYKGSLSANFDILPISIVNATILGISNRYSYTGSEISPPFTVTMKGKTLEPNTDYTFTFTDNVNITKRGYLTVEGIGNYKESVGAYFEIYN